MEPIPHKTVQPELLSPFTEFPNAGEFVPSHVGTDLPPYYDILGIQRTGGHCLCGTEAVKVGKAKRPSGRVGVEIAPHPTKDERMLRVSC